MPKMKTNRGAAKRYKRTGTGRIKRRRAFRNHILTKKAHKRKVNLRPQVAIKDCDVKAAERLLAIK